MSCPTDAVGSRVSGVGTAAYAAPEVICMEFYSPASDVWSYGVVIWEIFTMLEPFKEFDRAQQLVNIGRNRQKLFIPRVECDFPEFMDALLTRCWADERADRPSFSYILEYLSEVQKDAFFTLSSKEFTVIQDAWRLEISNESELSLSESCSSEASSPLRRQNEYLQRENAKMRDALQTLQLNEARYRGTIAGLQKNNQILSVLVANTLYNNTAALAAPAPRKKPFVKSLFRRNEQKTVSQSPMPTGDGDSQSGAPDRSPRDYSPAVKPGGRRHGARKPSKSSPGISYPSEVRHVVHVPSELVFDQANALPTTLYRGLNFSPGSCAYIAPSVPSPTSPTLFAGGSTSSSSFLRPRTDSQSTEPPLHPGSLIFSPSDDAAETARFFAFLNVHNGFTAPQPTSQKRSQQKRQAKSLNVEGLTSYKSAPELSEQVNRSVTKLNTLEGRHTVSRGSTLEPSTSSSRKPVTSLASGSQGGGGGSSKRHRMGLSALFHTSRSKHSSTSGKPSSPLVESVSCLPPAPPSTTEPSPTPLLPPSTTSVTTVQPHRLGNKRKSFSTTPRKILLHKIFQTERNKQRRINSGNSKTSPSVTASNQTESTSPASPKYLPEQATQSSSEFENMKAVMETSQSALVPAAGTIPPLPPYLLRQGIKAKEPRRRLLDIVRSPPSLFSSTVFSNARPYAPSNISDEEVKGEFRRRQFVRCPKSQSLDILFQPEEMNGTDVSKGQEEVNPMNPVPLALWSALKIASLAPLLLGSQNRINMSTVPSRSEPPTAPQSASFTRVTFSPFTFNGEDLTATALGKAQSCLGRISSTLALTTAFVGRSRHPTRKPWNAQRELSAPTPSSSPWQQMLNHPPPVYYSPPPGGGPDTCCKCGCHSTGESRQSSSATTTTSSQSSSSWLPVDNPVALSRDAYLKVTQDGYLNRSAINGNFNNDDKAGGVQSPSMLLMQSVGGFSPSPLFSHSSFLHQQQRSSNSPTASFLGSPDAVDPVDDVILLPGEEVGEPSFGAGEAAEDTATLYAEFQQLPNQTSYEAVFDASMSEVRSVERGGYAPIPDLSIPVPHEPGGTTGSTADRPTDLLSFPCRRRKAFRLKDKPEGLLSSPEDEVESDAGCSDNSTIPLTP
uniref:Protein kinase domain-containing protein n=1 Tax=Mesocestoides corti TaxID=53468 RepID=A0A5K3ERE3_MESCO